LYQQTWYKIKKISSRTVKIKEFKKISSPTVKKISSPTVKIKEFKKISRPTVKIKEFKKN